MKASPTKARILTGSSTATHPSTAGPRMIPRAISTTSPGKRTRGTRPSNKRELKAIDKQMARLAKESCGMMLCLPAGRSVTTRQARSRGYDCVSPTSAPLYTRVSTDFVRTSVPLL